MWVCRRQVSLTKRASKLHWLGWWFQLNEDGEVVSEINPEALKLMPLYPSVWRWVDTVVPVLEEDKTIEEESVAMVESADNAPKRRGRPPKPR